MIASFLRVISNTRGSCVNVVSLFQEEEKEVEAPMEEEDLVEKAEKEFFSIIEQEKKKQTAPAQDFEKGDTGKVNFGYIVVS